MTSMTTMTIKPHDSKLNGTYDNLAVQERQLYADGICVGACDRWIMENYPCLVRDPEWRNRPWGHFPDVE